MISKPLLHPRTAAALERTIARPAHGLLLVGPAGIGKATVATWLGAAIFDVPPEKLADYPHLMRLTPEAGKTIGIEAVRELEHFVSLKIPAHQAVNRLVIIDDAHQLTTEAQNALLKLIEEPPAGTLLLLTSSQQGVLLPTIRSRLQIIEVTPPPLSDLEQLLPDSANKQQIISLSGGLPGLAMSLASDDRTHPLVTAAQTARQLLQEEAFDKLTRVDSLSKDKTATQNMLYILMQMAHTALLTGKNGARWQKILTAAYDAQAELAAGVQPKLALTELMLNL